MALAHKRLPFGTIVRFRNPKNQRTLEAIVADRGPYIKGREFDIAELGAEQLGFKHRGVTELEYAIIGRTDPRGS